MADITYSDLNSMTYSQLGQTTYALQKSDPEPPTPTTGCCWTSATVTSLQNSISSLMSQVSALQTAVNAIPTATYNVPTTAQISAAVWGNASRTITGTVTVNNAQAATFTTATGFATPSDVTTAKDAILTRGNSAWTTATGFATPSDIPSDYAKASAVSAVQTSVDAIPTTTYNVPTTAQITSAVWGATTKEITGDVNVSSASIASIKSGLSTFDPDEDPVTVNSTQATAFSQVADVSGLATAANLATALTLLNKLFGLIGYFSVSSNTLTTYNSAGTALATYTLTRDSSQNITGVTPNE